MKKINYIKFALDIVLGIVFALLFNTRVFGGLTFHEVAGLSIGFAILVHIVLNWRWVKNVTLSIFSRKINLKTRIGYILNILLFIDMAVIIISGIFISRVLFTGLGIQNSFFNQSTHIAASYIGLAIIGIHLGLHWKWIMNVFSKIVRIKQVNKVLGYTAKAAALLVLVFGIYSMVTANYFANTARIFVGGSQAAIQHNMGSRPNFQLQAPAQGGSGTVGGQHGQGNFGVPNDNSQGFPDRMGGNPNFAGRGRAMRGASILGVLSSYLSITGVFAVVTYYIEKLLSRRKTVQA